MKKPKKEASQAPASPYLAARREWNERYGDQVNAAKNWRFIAFGSIGIALVAVIGLVAVSMQSKVVPYAVELNGHSEVVRVQRADVMRQPGANEIRAALRSWIIGARTVYTDPAAEKNLLDATYGMTLPDSPAYQRLANFHRANNPYQQAQNETVGVEVHVVSPVSDKTWQIEWTETTRQISGKVVSTKDWQANVTVQVSAPTDAQQIMTNPLGLYVNRFDWTPRLSVSDQ